MVVIVMVIIIKNNTCNNNNNNNNNNIYIYIYIYICYNIIALSNKNERLSITIETTLFETAFSDVSFNLVIGKFFLFRKPNNQLHYTNTKSNHPPSIIKDLPNKINKRLSQLCCNEEQYKKAKPLYETALNESGYKTTIT